MDLPETGSIGANDKRIFGTGDRLGAITLTADAKFLRVRYTVRGCDHSMEIQVIVKPNGEGIVAGYANQR